jgi:hypothetical protein
MRIHSEFLFISNLLFHINLNVKKINNRYLYKILTNE